MGMLSWIPPIVPMTCVILLLISDSISFLLNWSLLSSRWLSVIAYSGLCALSVIRYRSAAERLQIEVDGFLVKNGQRKGQGTTKNPKLGDGASVGGTVTVPASTWPPIETLGWTPFKSLSFNKVNPKGPPHFWSKSHAASFLVRSVGYKQNKLKEPSNFPLYECIGVDLVKANKLISSLTSNSTAVKRLISGEPSTETPWPWLKGAACRWKPEFGIPRLLIINCQLPYSAPSLWAPQSPDSDPGFSIISYYVMNPALADSLGSGKLEPPAVKLLRRLIEEGQSRKEGTALKTIGVVDNMEEIGFPDIVSGYNGKPVLVTKSAQLSFWPAQNNCEVLEIEYDVRQWSILARKTLHSLREKFKDAKCQLGMVIEGQNDDELPEQLLGCFRVNFLDIIEALSIEI
jgi:hypothetical protein